MDELRLMVGVSGVRGVVGSTMTPLVAAEFGAAFGTMLAAQGPGRRTVTLARDTRPSGPALARAMAAGLLATGADVVDLGAVSTPAAAVTTAALNAAGGTVITASHNPGEYNGLKFLQPTGTALTAEMAGRLKDLWQSRSFAWAPADAQGRESADPRAPDRHVDAVCAACDPAAVAAEGFKVVLDSVNGAGCVETPMLLERLGCDLVHLNAEPTGRFAHPPEPVAGNLGDLCRAVRDAGAAVGFAQDADADRLAIVDENGTFIGEEYTLALAAAFILRHRTGSLATNLATSRMIDDVASARGCQVVRAPTGEANVVEAMRAGGCIFGGEGGGGVIDPRVGGVRDSLVAIACVLQYLAETHRTVSELLADIPPYVMLKTKFPCPAGAADEVAAAAREAFEGREGARFNDADGLRIDLPGGWVCARASNTEPIMRIIAEARQADAAKALVDEVRAIADRVIGARK